MSKKDKDTYIKKKKDMNFQSVESMQSVVNVVNEAATAINAGKVYFTQNPMAISYPQWIAFAKYSYKQLKWVLIEKPNARDAYVHGKINEQLAEVLEDVDSTFDEIFSEYIVVLSED